MTVTLVSSHAILLCLLEPTPVHAHFDARFEHEIHITTNERAPVATLSSLDGPQTQRLDAGCYTIENWYTPESTWYPGKAKVFDDYSVGWEDAVDDDFNDAWLTIGERAMVVELPVLLPYR